MCARSTSIATPRAAQANHPNIGQDPPEETIPKSHTFEGMSTITATATTTAPTFAKMSLSADNDDAKDIQPTPRPRPRPNTSGGERIPSYAESRISSYSKRSRPHSAALPPFHSSLSFALVRDFAYPTYHPMHYGAPPESQSGASTPGSEWNAGRRMSDSAEGSVSSSRGSWTAGPWGGDGAAMYGDPEEMDPLPSTSFGNASDEWGEDETSFKKSKHRKSRSFADMPSHERGRRRESGNRHSEYSSYDPAGRTALRHSRGFAQENGGEHHRRDSHLHQATLPSRSFHQGQPVDPDEEIPLDSEPSTHSPQRESLGPEDEDFAGPSLALYGFEPENDNELRLSEGQTIMVSYRHGQGWLVAENPQTGEQGLVPEQYVRLLRDIEGWDEEKGCFVDDDELVSEEMDAVEEHSGKAENDTSHVPNTTVKGDDFGYESGMKKSSNRAKQ